MAGESELGFSLTAVGSGRSVSPGSIGTPALLICFTQETQSGIDPVEAVAREVYPRASQLFIAHVVDLHKVPSIFRKVAEGILNGEHKKAVEALPPGVSAEDYVVVLPDWDGAAVKALGLDDVSRTMGLVLLDSSGAVSWRYQSPQPAVALRERLAESL